MPALFPALAGVTAYRGRAWIIEATSCAGIPTPADSPVIAAQLIGHVRFLGNIPPAETRFREHHPLLGPCAGRDGVATDQQRRPQGRPCRSSRTPRFPSPRQLARTVHQQCCGERGRDGQQGPHIDRPPGHPRAPGPYAASPVGRGPVRVPRRPRPPASRHGRHCLRTLCRCAARPVPAGLPVLPVRTTFREVANV